MKPKANLFIVEDESIVAMDLRQKLVGNGYGILGIASTGEEAVKRVLELKPDLVLMDIHLRGEMDGITAAAIIQEAANIPVIYLTAFADTSTLTRAKITGPYGYILKPYEERELEVNIEINLQKIHLEQQLRTSAETLASSLKELERANSVLAALGQVAARIQQNHTPEKIFNTLGEELELLGIHCAVLLYKNEADTDLTISYISLPIENRGQIEQRSGVNLVGYVLKKEACPHGQNPITEPLLIPQGKAMLDQVFSNEIVDIIAQLYQTGQNPGDIRFLYLPLAFAQRIFGGLVVWGTGFYDRDIAAIEIFANQFAIALENSRLLQLSQHISNTDPLTGVYNRRYFLDFAQREYDLYQRHGHEFSIIMIDLDHFKGVNDRYGHLSGDHVLNQVVQRIRGELRSTDILSRFGGEEFIILLPETLKSSAIQAAERIREVIARLPIQSNANNIFVSASLGVAQLDNTIQNLEGLIHNSDLALYRAKAEGRNCVRAF
jgi:diguanylate cyclase (GGDEF)-like protein